AVAEPHLVGDLHDAGAEVIFDDAGAAAYLAILCAGNLLEASRCAFDARVGGLSVHGPSRREIGKQIRFRGPDAHAFLERPAAALGTHVSSVGSLHFDRRRTL